MSLFCHLNHQNPSINGKVMYFLSCFINQSYIYYKARRACHRERCLVTALWSAADWLVLSNRLGTFISIRRHFWRHWVSLFFSFQLFSDIVLPTIFFQELPTSKVIYFVVDLCIYDTKWRQCQIILKETPNKNYFFVELLKDFMGGHGPPSNGKICSQNCR